MRGSAAIVLNLLSIHLLQLGLREGPGMFLGRLDGTVGRLVLPPAVLVSMVVVVARPMLSRSRLGPRLVHLGHVS